MWVATGATELDYKLTGGTFDDFWCDPADSSDSTAKITLATLKNKAVAGSQLIGGSNGNSVEAFGPEEAKWKLVPVLTQDALNLYGAKCACCALCLAQNMNTKCDGDGGGNPNTQPMRVGTTWRGWLVDLSMYHAPRATGHPGWHLFC